jgi:hypothetical protein
LNVLRLLSSSSSTRARTAQERVNLFARYAQRRAQSDALVDDAVRAAVQRQVSGGSGGGGGGSAAAPAAAPAATPAKKAVVQRPIEDEDCVICFDALKGSGAVVWCQLSCGGSLHKGCMDAWSSQKRQQHQPVTCPYCRAEWCVVVQSAPTPRSPMLRRTTTVVVVVVLTFTRFAAACLFREYGWWLSALAQYGHTRPEAAASIHHLGLRHSSVALGSNMHSSTCPRSYEYCRTHSPGLWLRCTCMCIALGPLPAPVRALVQVLLPPPPPLLLLLLLAATAT